MYFDARSPFGTAAPGGAVSRAKVDIPGAGNWTLPQVLVGIDGSRLSVNHW